MPGGVRRPTHHRPTFSIDDERNMSCRSRQQTQGREETRVPSSQHAENKNAFLFSISRSSSPRSRHRCVVGLHHVCHMMRHANDIPAAIAEKATTKAAVTKADGSERTVVIDDEIPACLGAVWRRGPRETGHPPNPEIQARGRQHVDSAAQRFCK
jgi:hypothetical protein